MSDAPKLSLTTPKQVVVSVLSGAAFCWLLLTAFEAFGTFPPVVPWSVPGLLVFLAVCVFIYARLLPRRLQQRTVSPQESFAAVGVAKAMIYTGAVFAGAHVVYVARYVTKFHAPLPEARVVQGGATIVAALLLAGAGAILERACVVKDDDEDEKKKKGGGSAEHHGHPEAI